MRIGVFNVKGGVGKTALSVALYNDLRAKAYYSNEQNTINNLNITLLNFKNAQEKRKMIIEDNAIFDFGGFSDDICDFIRICDLIVIPTTRDKLAIQKAFLSMKTIEKLNNKILLVMTRVLPKFNEICDQAVELINQNRNYHSCYLNESKIFSDVIDQNKGVLELGEQFAYKNKAILTQWQNFLSLIKTLAKEN